MGAFILYLLTSNMLYNKLYDESATRCTAQVHGNQKRTADPVRLAARLVVQLQQVEV